MMIDAKAMIERLRDYAHETYGEKPGECGIVAGRSLASFAIKGRDRIVSGTVNTDDTDLDREVVLPSGAITADYMKRNQSVFVDHQYDITRCVGKCRTLTIDTKGRPQSIRAVSSLLPDENEYAKAVRMLLEAGGVGLSIGFEALERGRPTPDEKELYPKAESIVRRWKMIEYSFTAMPCNVACQADSWSVDDSKAVRSSELIVKSFKDSARILKAFGLPRPVVVVVV